MTCLRPQARLMEAAIAALATVPMLTAPADAMFQRLETKTKTPCYHQLTRILDIPYQCWKFEDPDAKLPVWKDSLGFEFGQLTRQQWETIAIAYASWRTSDGILQSDSLPPFDPNHQYWLMDFMPAIMQATNRHRFISQHQPPSLDQKNTAIVSNCWGTLYEIFRLRQASAQETSYLMMLDAHTIFRTFQSISTRVDSPQPGDFLFISHHHFQPNPSLSESAPYPRSGTVSSQTYLDHAALFIDKGILFEKAGAGDHVPYRLIGLSTLQRIWRRDVFDHSIHRPIANPVMPHPLSFRFKDSTLPITVIIDHDPQRPSQQQYSIFPLPSLIEAQGKVTLPPDLYQPDYFTRLSSQSPKLR